MDLTIYKAIIWTLLYLGVMLIYTFIDISIWRKLLPDYSAWLNITTIALCVFGFILILKKYNSSFELRFNVDFKGILLAVLCSFLFYIVLDKGLDPFFANLFPESERQYQAALQTLGKTPLTSFLYVCIIAPAIEEILMRGFVLDGLKNSYDPLLALVVSSILFAILHFNWLQTLSALICGLTLGLLYIKTDSVICCIIAHSGYNFISFITTIYKKIE